MTIYELLIVALVMTALAVAWFGLHYYLNPLLENPDGIAKVTGSCGDTMEIALRFKGLRVEDVHCWTDGCAVSKMCIETVGMLALGKTVPELRAIDTPAIMERVGNLPDTHLHCAVLAETTLRKAVTDYKLKNPARESRPLEHGERNLPLDEGLPQPQGPKYIVYIFPSSNYVMKAEKILKGFGIDHKIIPVPRHISSDCGVCLRTESDQRQAVDEILKGKVAWERVATL